MKIRYKLSIPIIIQIILVIIIGVGSFFLISEINRIKGGISHNMSVSADVKSLNDTFMFHNCASETKQNSLNRYRHI